MAFYALAAVLHGGVVANPLRRTLSPLPAKVDPAGP
jgi:hypothetical protein